MHHVDTSTTRRNRLIRVASGWSFLLVLCFAAGAITIATVRNTSYGPENTVQRYLSALREGDGETAIALLNPTTPTASAAVLQGEPLKRAVAALGQLNIGTAEKTSETTAKVPVSFTADGTQHTTVFQLQSKSKDWLFFDNWTFAPNSLPTVDLSVPNNSVASLNGIEVNVPHGQNQFAALYPGVYTASLSTPNFQATEQHTVLTSNSDNGSLSLTPQPSNRLLDQVNSQLKSFLDGCASQQVLLPTGCPLSAATSNRILGPVSWQITQYPSAQITPYNNSWSIAPLSFRAKVSYEEQSLLTGEKSSFSREFDFGFSATLAITDSSVTVTPLVKY